MIIYPLLGGLSWILQSFVDKEVLKSVSIESFILLKFICIGTLVSIIFLLTKIINPSFANKIIQQISKVRKSEKILKKLFVVSVIGMASMYFHFLGYTKFKISNFVALETIFSIIISIGIGYYFFNEKLEKNEILGIIVAIISIMIFYYKDLKKLL